MYRRLITKLFLRVLASLCHNRRIATQLRKDLLPRNPDAMLRHEYALYVALVEVTKP